MGLLYLYLKNELFCFKHWSSLLRISLKFYNINDFMLQLCVFFKCMSTGPLKFQRRGQIVNWRKIRAWDWKVVMTVTFLLESFRVFSSWISARIFRIHRHNWCVLRIFKPTNMSFPRGSLKIPVIWMLRRVDWCVFRVWHSNGRFLNIKAVSCYEPSMSFWSLYSEEASRKLIRNRKGVTFL